MVTFPPCKINLGLYVLSKRPDGFHNIHTCFYPVPWTDVLEVIESNQLEFISSGISIPGAANDNLCMKAYHMMKQIYDLPPVKICLHKIIPMGAGLGGGSSDGAYLIQLLNDQFQLHIPLPALRSLALQLGSDCSFFFQHEAMIGSGRGEVLEPLSLSLKDKFLVIVKPDVHVSTAAAYRGVVPGSPGKDLRSVLSAPLENWRHDLKNDFEDSVFFKHPIVEKIKTDLYSAGAIYASMSGSGSSVFGLFDAPVNLKEKFADCVYWGGVLAV
jgi:4-diphosphocytidyl-2-C-methyl-D-erythritol kinase